jgi:hypothetical protein
MEKFERLQPSIDVGSAGCHVAVAVFNRLDPSCDTQGDRVMGRESIHVLLRTGAVSLAVSR